jgi:hypothetical protein
MASGGSGSPGGSNFQVQYNNSSAFGGATGMTWNNDIYLLQVNSLNQATAIAVGLRLENGTSTSGGQTTRWSPALEFVARNGITNQLRNRFTAEVVPSAPDDYRAALRFKYSLDTGVATFSNNLFLIHSTFGIGIGASNTSFNNAIYFRAPSNLATDHQYVLPLLQPSAGGFGSSVLSSDTSGNLTWVPMAAGGTGSGTVNSGTGGSFAVYLSTGSAVSGSNLITFTGSGVTIGSNVNSSSTTAGALTVYGGIAVTGNAFIGGTTTITNTTASTSTSSGALVVSGGVGVGGSIFVNNNVILRSQGDLVLWNSGNTFYTALQAGNTAANYTLSFPTQASSGFSAMMADASGQMFFVAAGAGIAFSANNANIATIRQKRALTMQFCAGYTPVAAGPDTVVLKVPDSAVDGLTDITYILREIDIRVETPSAGQSRIQLEKYSGTTAFTLGATGSSMIAGLGITLTGAGTHFTSTNSFVAGSLVTSNDKLRVSWTLLNATHANFSIQLTMEEV